MYRPAAYAVDDVAVLHSVVQSRRFATIAAASPQGVRLAYAPVVLDPLPEPLGTLRFHLARSNPLSDCDDVEWRLSFLAADAYVSPDWYETPGFVPTWNYIAVEAAGQARRLDRDALYQSLVELAFAAEENLRPKKPWTIEKLAAKKVDALLNAICGFSLQLESLEGKFKLSQDKKRADIAGVIAGLDSRGDAASLAVARAMKATLP